MINYNKLFFIFENLNIYLPKELTFIIMSYLKLNKKKQRFIDEQYQCEKILSSGKRCSNYSKIIKNYVLYDFEDVEDYFILKYCWMHL